MMDSHLSTVREEYCLPLQEFGKYALGAPDRPKEMLLTMPTRPRRLLPLAVAVLLVVPFVLGGSLAYWAAQRVGIGAPVQRLVTDLGVENPLVQMPRSAPAQQPASARTPVPVERSTPDLALPKAATPVPSATALEFETEAKSVAPARSTAVEDMADVPAASLAEPVPGPEAPIASSGSQQAPASSAADASSQPDAAAPPGSAAVEARPRAPQQDSEANRSRSNHLLDLGDSFLAAGDIEWARRYYETALSEGDARGALAMGWTFDPIYRERSNQTHLMSDPRRAIAWYREAGEMGAGTPAQARLDDLYQWLYRKARNGDASSQDIIADWYRY